MDVEGAWRQGFTGRGVSVTILDDGIEKDHPGMQFGVVIFFLIYRLTGHNLNILR